LRRTSRFKPCIWLWVEHSVVVLSLRLYDTRDHIPQFCCAIRSRGQSCALLSCAHQGAIYCGGRRGIVAAAVRVAQVGVSSHTLPLSRKSKGETKPTQLIDFAPYPVSIVVRMK
jgi:hypothetical protein